MEKKFTKGKWVVSSNRWGCVDLADGGRLVAYAKKEIGEYNSDDIEEANANARLVSQAPNLLDRIEKLMLSVKAHPDYISGEDGDEWHDLISLSQEVINKAL